MANEFESSDVARRPCANSTEVRRYRYWDTLFEGERRIFKNHAESFSGRVLDIGIGVGRTTSTLGDKAARYVGLELSPAKVRVAKDRFPALDIREMDMREVPKAFDSVQFDVILISYNSIDYIPWSDRQPLLTSLGRLLSDGGLLILSAHSLEFLRHNPPRLRSGGAERSSWQGLQFQLCEHENRIYRLARWSLGVPPTHRIRMKRLEMPSGGCALVNDNTEYPSALPVYVSLAAQHRQFQRAGLTVIERVGGDRPYGASFFYYYVTQRASKAAK